MNSRLLALSLVIATAPLVHAEDLTIATIRKKIEAARKAGNVPGLSVAIVKDGKVIFSEGFGYQDVQKRRRATADTVYEIGSTTKAFTALLATQAAQEGKLSLSDRPIKYLPKFRLKDSAANAKITLEDMLSHRSGLARTDLVWYAADFHGDDLLDIAAQVQSTAPLGARWQYQNLMVAFVGMVLEKTYGETYHQLLKERFFGPLGMAHSDSTYAATKAQKELATGYPNMGPASGANPLALKEVDRIAPAGTISSSVRDMSAYLQMLLADGKFSGKQLFAAEAVEETRKPRIEIVPGSGQAYGLGWMLKKDHGIANVFHGGNIDGYTANVALWPSEHLGVVALSNADTSSVPAEVAEIVIEALGPKDKDEAAKKFTEAVSGEMGTFRNAAPPVEITFVMEAKSVIMNQNGQRIPLKLVGEKRYTYQNIFFVTFGALDKDGKKGVKVEQGALTLMLKPAEPYKSPIDAVTLLAKEVEAKGGAEAIRRHDRGTVHYHRSMPNNAIDIYGIRYRRDEASEADYAHWYAINRKFADSVAFADGQGASTKTSFTRPSYKSGRAAAIEMLESNLEADLQPMKFYKSLEVVREDKVGTVPVYVLQKTTASGAKISDFISKADFRVLRRQTSSGAGREEYSDFRTVDGVTIPFKTTVYEADGTVTTEEIQSIRFGGYVPGWVFKR